MKIIQGLTMHPCIQLVDFSVLSFYSLFLHFLFSPHFTVDVKITLIIDFWTNTYTYYEAPRVNFNNEYIITVLEDGVSKFYSSHSFMNLLYPNTLKAPLLQVTPFDVNGNSYNYKYNILFKFNSNPSKVQNIRLILFWDYILKVKLSIK